ncbi:MAG: class I SAM-dependent methyltransferase [Saprospiraceae bacterium]
MKAPAQNYIEQNKAAWNNRLDHHVQSDFYDMAAFRNGKNSLKSIELALLGEVSGKSILHLQCHFGQDSLSLARMGAKVTGADLSDKAIQKAREINEELGLDAKFICCDLYDLPKHLDGQFDFVFTSYGTIGWLPDMDKWAAIVARYLKPGGQLIFADFHPVVWMFDDNFDFIEYRYFKSEPIVDTQTGTYADRSAPIEIVDISWNHSMSEVITSLLGQGLRLVDLQEYDYSPYDCFQGMNKVAEDKFTIQKMGDKLPLVYSMVVQKD